MKWSSVATALCALPLVLGAVLQAEVVARGDHQNNGNGNHGVPANKKQIAGGEAHVVVVLWINTGGGAATQKMNEPVTVVVNAANPAAVAPAATHTVVVGGEAGLLFTPDTISAPINDVIHFVFHSQNHTVTQSTFDSPCKKLEGGFDSGFMPNKDNSVVPPPMMAMQITTDKPLWFYCKQKTPASHCGKGMTFSINATPEKSQGKFKDLAVAQAGAAPAPPAAPPVDSAAPAPAPPATNVNAPAPVATESAAPVASSAAASAPAAAPTEGVVPGSGSGAGGECGCSCFCGTTAFPAADQGVGSFGGMPGVIAMSAMT